MEKDLEKLGFEKKKQANYSNRHVTDEKEAGDANEWKLDSPSALDTLIATFGLSEFETKILILCAGVELDSRFSTLLTQLNGGKNGSSVRLTFGIAMAAFANAHWSAISPNSPLRYWNLILPTDTEHVTGSNLQIDENVLHYLVGNRYMDEKLTEILDPVYVEYSLAPSQVSLAGAIATSCRTVVENGSELSHLPFIQLRGDEYSDQMADADLASSKSGYHLYKLSILSLPANPKEVSNLLRCWNRESALNTSMLYIDCAKLNVQDKLRVQLAINFIENVQGFLIIGGFSNDVAGGTKRWKLEYEVQKPSIEEQMILWKSQLGEEFTQRLDGQLEKIVSQFNLSAKALLRLL
ncbi:MAG: hypothetical protein IPM82_12105 [Saprospiraceae bacterium]|nr:hypothetical protein [Saprospiraceae bacterium]